MDNNRFYNASRSVLTGALKTTRQLNKRQKDILGFIYSQAEFMHAPVYREHGSIAISSASLSQACRPAVSCMTALSIAYELEKAGFLKIERANKGEKGVANRYTLTDQFFEWMKVTNDELKKDVDMDQDNELNRQNQSLQERVDELTHQLEEARKANDAGNAYDEIPDGWRAQTVEIRQNDGRTVTRTKGQQFDIEMAKGGRHPMMRLVDAFGKFSQMQKELDELKRENTELKKALEADNAEMVKKFNDANKERFNEWQQKNRLKDENRIQKAEIDRLKRYEDVFKRLVRDGVIDQKGNPVGGGSVTVEPGEPYGIMKPDELLHEFSTVIKNKN